jgi:hypothetical protein
MLAHQLLSDAAAALSTKIGDENRGQTPISPKPGTDPGYLEKPMHRGGWLRFFRSFQGSGAASAAAGQHCCARTAVAVGFRRHSADENRGLSPVSTKWWSVPGFWIFGENRGRSAVFYRILLTLFHIELPNG